MTNLRTFLTAVLLVAFAIVVSARAEDAANHYPFAAGTVKKLDTTDKLLTILTPKGLLTLGLTDRTYMYRGKEKLAAEKLRVGDSVKINYYTNETGQAFVRRLKVSPASPPEELPAP